MLINAIKNGTIERGLLFMSPAFISIKKFTCLYIFLLFICFSSKAKTKSYTKSCQLHFPEGNRTVFVYNCSKTVIGKKSCPKGSLFD